MASVTNGASLWRVSRIGLVRGETLRISHAAPKPLRSGIERSRMAMSGCRTWARRTASRPSVASPTTLSPSPTRRFFTPWRTMTWSSASRIRSDISESPLGAARRAPTSGRARDRRHALEVLAADRVDVKPGQAISVTHRFVTYSLGAPRRAGGRTSESSFTQPSGHYRHVQRSRDTLGENDLVDILAAAHGLLGLSF